MTRYAQTREDDMCVNCGHERAEHRNWRCFAEDYDGNECSCDDATFDEAPTGPRTVP